MPGAHRNNSPQLIAGGTIYPHRFVKVSTAADNTVLACGANERAVGISQQGTKFPTTNPTQGLLGTDQIAAAAGDNIMILSIGDVGDVEAGGTVTRGDLLEPYTAGTAIKSSSARNAAAYCLESGVIGQLVRVQILPHWNDDGQIQILTGGTGDKAITITQGTVIITKGSAATDLTLAAPTAGSATTGGDDGKVLRISGGGAYAHVITQTTPGFNAGSTASDVATFGTAVCQCLILVAYNGAWYVVSNLGVTIA